MKTKITYLKKPGGLTKLLFFLAIFLVSAQTQTRAQTKEYANSQENWRSGTGLLAEVNQPEKAADGDESTNAELISRLINIGVIQTSGESWVQMNFQTPVPLNATTYVKIDAPTTTGGLNLDLLSILGGLLGILESDLLNVEVYNGSTPLNPTEFKANVVEDSNGQSYVAITSTENYTGIRVRLKYVGNLLGVSLGSGINLNVYEAFYYTDAPDCGRPLYTYYEDSGLNIGLLEFQNRNLNNAIDSEEDTYSQLKQGALLGVNVAGSQSQVFNFGSSSSETATLNIKLLLGSGGVLNTDLLGAAEVILYNGAEKVYQRSLQSSLLNNTDLLGSLQNGEPITMTFAPGRAFDRAEVRLTSPVGVSLLDDALKIYDVQRYDENVSGCENPEIADLPDPTDDPFDVASCSSDLIDFDNVDFAQRAVDGNNESYATLYADAGNLLVSGSTAGFIEMGMGATLPAGKTTYVRIGYDQDVLDALLGGSIGGLLGDALNGLALGDQYIQVQAKDNGNPVLDVDGKNGFEGQAGNAVTLVQDKIGRYYLAITPDEDYDAIRITNHVDAVLPTGKKASLDVYNACFETGNELCFPANFTSYHGGGLDLSVGNLSEVGVKDPYKAISDNSSEYSEINPGILTVGGRLYQSIYFSQLSQPGDSVQIKLMVEPSSALSLDLLGNYKIKFYNGDQQVGNDYNLEDAVSLINNINVLDLFNSGGAVTLNFVPEDEFDRVDIGMESPVQANLNAEPLRVYSVKRFGDDCPLPFTPPPFVDPYCAVELIDSDNADDVNNLFDDNFDTYATLKSGAGTLLGINDDEGFVEMGFDAPVEAGTTAYIRFDFDQRILNALVSGSLGNFAADLLNNVVLGDHYFEVEVKDANGDLVLNGSSKEATAGGNEAIRVVQDKLGRYYIAITPNEDYQSVRISDHTDSAVGLLAAPNTMNIYGMCTEQSKDKCSPAFATSHEYSGLNLGVDPLGGAGVTNPEYAIDDNTQHYSEISSGTIGVGVSTKQWIFFNSVSNTNDIAVIKFRTEGGGIDLDLLGGLEIKAYLGDDEVAQFDFQDGLINGVNILDLLNTDQIVELNFRPGLKYDGISVGINTVLQASVFPPIQLYSVDRVCVSNAYAKDDINQVPQDEPVSGNVLTNDEGENLTVTSLDYYDDQGNLQTLELNNASATKIVYTEGPNPVKAGEIEIHPDGTYTYTPDPDFTGTVKVSYTATDDNDNSVSDDAILTIKVLPYIVNDNPPVAQNDTNTVEQDETVVNNVLANDSHVDGENLMVTEATGLDSAGAPVALSTTPTDVYAEDPDNPGTYVLAGQATLNPDGTISFTADAGFTGDVPIEYSILDEDEDGNNDANGNDSDTATLVITVEEADATDNDTFANDDASVGPVDVPQTISALDNDYDPEVGDIQTINTITVDTDGDGTPEVITPVAGTAYDVYQDTDGDGTPELIGKITVNPTTGVSVFDPVPDFVGTAVIPYEVIDNNANPTTDDATMYFTTLDSVCTYTPTAGTPAITYVGISTLNRNVENWLATNPDNQLGAFVVLESDTKPFVVTRMSDPDGSVSSPVEGMVVWDTDNYCLKLYDGTQWKCLEQGCVNVTP